MMSLHLRKFIIALLTIVFTGFIYKSFKELESPQHGISLGTKKIGVFPSLTICPISYLNGERPNKFEDYDKFPSLLDFVKVKGLFLSSFVDM